MKLSDALKLDLGKLQNKAEELVKDDAATLEQIEAITKEMENLQAKIKMQEQVENAEMDEVIAEISGGGMSPLDNGANDKIVYEDAFYNALAGRALTAEQNEMLLKVNNALSSGTGEDGGYLIPVDQQVSINELKRAFEPLEGLVTVEPVSTLTGSRNLEKDAQYTPFVEFAEGENVPETDSPQFMNITYQIKDRGGILPVPNNLLADNKANLQAYLNRWLAKKSVATRNKLIVDLLNAKAKTAIAGIDDVKNVLNVTLDPAISAVSEIIMNQDSFNVFDKMKDVDGKYLLQPDPTNPTKKLLAGRPVKVVSNKTIATRTDATTSKKYAPVIIGSLKEAIVLFDRQATSLLATSIGGTAFGKNRTEIRAITREDVKGFDMEAIAYGEIEVQ
ncbi:phage major capsid protein [Anaerotignum sp. MB30-C6]|uniref:phage major capsid protein n=1 Tax=Anaerotignum sp. MB30-C6 TaxID=3070814 RepID=UPI0027DBEAD6|nr:phage major capsid protein [Anaerotignum sp. MB30-C6]WMI80909.1 phage major capsid protein [Anaerotignum sp. MB30-C6]